MIPPSRSMRSVNGFGPDSSSGITSSVYGRRPPEKAWTVLTDPAPTPTRTPEPPGRRWPVSTGWLVPRRTGSGAAKAAFVVGLLYAAVSAYWGLGGRWLLATVGGALQSQGRAGTAVLVVAVWAAVIIKLVAAVLPLLALRRVTSPGWNRAVGLLAWIEAGILTVYGLVWTVVGMLVQAGAIHPSARADHRASAWHAYLWDPWFLIWGLLVALALWRGRRLRWIRLTGDGARRTRRWRSPPRPVRRR